MSTTAKRIAELEASIEGQQPGVALNTYPAKLSQDSLVHLCTWADRIAAKSLQLADWLRDIAVAEIFRRGRTSQPIEAQAARMPVDWSNNELADALECALVVLASNQDRGLDKLLEEVAFMLAVQSGNRLRNQ